MTGKTQVALRSENDKTENKEELLTSLTARIFLQKKKIPLSEEEDWHYR
jgi:hypothetical protein